MQYSANCDWQMAYVAFAFGVKFMLFSLQSLIQV